MAESSDRPNAPLADEGRYRLLLDAVTDYAIFMLDRTGHVSSWNTGAQRFKGYVPAEIIGKHFSQFYSAADREAGVPARALETATREGRFETEGWRIRKDGSRFWAHVVIDPIRTPTGELVGFAKITRDLTERRDAETALRRSEEQFRLLVQSVTDYAIYMLDPAGWITSWNAGAQRIKGYAPEEIIGEHFSRFYTPEDIARGEPAKALETAAREGRFEKEGWRLRKDGNRFLANVVIDSIRDDRGVLIGFAKVTRDVTERTQARRALEKAREALSQSQKMDAIGQLTGGIAHDFNNLLTAIIGSLELAQKRHSDSKITSLLNNALEGARRGSALTQRMLAFARRQELRMVPIDILSLVRGMSDLLQRSLGPSVTIETRFPLKLAPVESDQNQLESALLNLAVNARDAMPKGGQIVIAAREETVGPDHGTGLPPGRYVALSVADTGEGMDAETLARATEPFFTTKGIGKGTGLGLSMVQGLTEQSGGRLVLRSRLGEGTTAEIWLPAAGAAAATSVSKAQTRPQAVGPSRRLVVLAVDDDSLVLMNTSALLDDLGHRVFEATSGRQALEILRREAIDVVITDQAMPQMTGMQLAEEIRKDWPDLPIILATGYAELPPGADTTIPKLAKPFYQDDLARLLAKTVAVKGEKGRLIEFRAR